MTVHTTIDPTLDAEIRENWACIRFALPLPRTTMIHFPDSSSLVRILFFQTARAKAGANSLCSRSAAGILSLLIFGKMSFTVLTDGETVRHERRKKQICLREKAEMTAEVVILQLTPFCAYIAPNLLLVSRSDARVRALTFHLPIISPFCLFLRF